MAMGQTVLTRHSTAVISRISDSSPLVRVAALKATAGMGLLDSLSYASRIADALGDECPRVRLTAVETLGDDAGLG